MKNKPSKLTVAILNALVLTEATKLKKAASKTELINLSFNRLRTQSTDGCIYGQITGNCFNSRATELIEASCKQVITRSDSCTLVTGTLNGDPKKANRREYWSPIEMFIDQPRNKENGNNERLIEFLKDETKTLKLK